jgi:cell division protein FtsW (lipid II flippase)
LTYGAIFLGLCVAGHLVIRWALPHADPYLFPLAAVLASLGIVMIYRISPTLARQQAQWMVVGLAVFAATIVLLRRFGLSVLEHYRYTIAVVAIAITILPRLPVIGGEVNGAYLDIRLGSLTSQPAELSKIAIVIFLASYLHENRQLLVTAGRRVLGVTLPPMKQFGPMLVIWGAAMATLLITSELGTSLMFYGAFLALLYVATGRVSFPLLGLALFALGSWFVITHVSHVHARVVDWEHPFSRAVYERPGGSYQLAQSLFAQADGGLLGTGFDRSLLELPHHGGSLLPIPQSDLIYAVITDELGLAGAGALLLTYLLFVARGLKVAALARDSFSKLLATGLSFVVAIQVFVIVGGLTRVIPLTGVTLPLVAYGGSSVVMNFVLLALLLVVSDRARRPYAGTGRPAASERREQSRRALLGGARAGSS